MSRATPLSSVDPVSSPHPIRWLRDHPIAADVLLAVFLTSISVAFHVMDVEGLEEYRSPSWWTTLFVIAAILPIAWRRSFPIRSGLFVSAAQIIAAFLDIIGSEFLGVTIALYSIGAHSVGRRRTRALWAIGAGTSLLFVLGLLVNELDIGSFISSTVILVTAFVLGDNLRRRREKADSLAERAERAEREQALIAEQQVSAERTRIARELHDVVAHSVSVMVIQAAAARRNLPESPDVAVVALGNIEETGRQTMTELRGILGVLRSESEGSARTPQPTLTDLDALVHGSTDLPISLELTGDLDRLAPSVMLTAYRVVQESITNIRRHAGPVTFAEVAVERSADRLIITITDDGRGAASDRPAVAQRHTNGSSSGNDNDNGEFRRGGTGRESRASGGASEYGYGIIGIHERVAAIGGTATAGPRSGGGWRVRVSMPAPFDPIPAFLPDERVDDIIGNDTTTDEKTTDVKTSEDEIGTDTVDIDETSVDEISTDTISSDTAASEVAR